MSDEQKSQRPEQPARDAAPVPPHTGEVTVGPLERSIGETADLAAIHGNERTVADGELPIEERRERGIKDNTRNVDSIGQR